MVGKRRITPPLSAPRYTRPPETTYDDPDLDDPNNRAEAHRYVRHQLVNNTIATQLIKRLTGRGAYGDTLVGGDPNNQFFAGALSSQYDYREAQEEGEAFKDIAEDVAPFTIGARFRVPADLPDDTTVTISPRAIAYQRRFPTYEEQLTHSNDRSEADVLYEEIAEEKDPQSVETVGDGGAAATVDEDVATVDEAGEGEGSVDRPTEEQELLRIYERVPFEFGSIELSASDIRDIRDRAGPYVADLTDAITGARSAAEDIDRRFRDWDEDLDESEANQIPPDSLADRESFEEYLGEIFTGTPMTPLWDARVEVEARPDTDPDGSHHINLTARLVNSHGEDYEEAEDPEYEPWRATLFDVGVAAEAEGTKLSTFRSDQIEDDYRYDGTIHGVGENCAVDPVYAEDSPNLGDASAIGVETRTVPSYRQARYLSRNPDDVAAPFAVLAGREGRDAVFETLTRIADAMKEAHDQYDDLQDEITAGKSSSADEQFETALADFDRERERFETGIQVLQDDDQAYESFTMMNEAFARLDFDRWRTFQIVYIVMTLPDIVAQARASAAADAASEDEAEEAAIAALDEFDDEYGHYLNAADVIYFPTGGGKTEAYFGLVAFTAFYDRLRGKHYGMTAFTKFPLRFLSLEQLERITNLLAKAELVRREHPDASEGEEFSVGYLVGKQNTPNKLYEGTRSQYEANIDYVEKARSDEEWQGEMRHLERCPFCEQKTYEADGTEREAVQIDGDDYHGRIVHRCKNPECDEDVLPLYVTDREVYRFAPTFVVSTIDKISIVGMQRRMRTLFGQAKIKCRKHGYSGESRCVAESNPLSTEGRCDEEDWEAVDPADPPSLLIQDELHLLREEFGAFDSHYETFLQAYYNRIAPGWRTKMVAATATIQGADDQVNALYQRDTVQFPSDGPRLDQSFYAFAHPTREQRRMVGLVPRTVSRTYAIEKIHEEKARIVQEYRDDPAALYEDLRSTDGPYDVHDANLPSDSVDRADALQAVLDDYEVQVSYHHSKDNTDLMMRVLRTMINPHLIDDGDPYTTIRGQLMTGDTAIDTVREVMDALDPGAFSDPGPDDIRMLIATSMISHGVDQPVLNLIAFFGLPRETAEYIQSYSRVGRQWPGTVVLLHDPMRTRDRGYYRQFQHHQAYQDLLVEATPLERWAEYAIECTMPGIFAAALLQYYDYHLETELDDRLYLFGGFKEATTNGHIDYDEMYRFIREAYGLPANPDKDPVDVTRPMGEPGGSTGIRIYERKIEEEFRTVWEAYRTDDNKIPEEVACDPESDESNFLSDVLERDNQSRKPMRSLRDIDEQILVKLDSETSSVINGYRQ